MYVLNLLPERAWPIYRYILKGCGVNGTGGRVPRANIGQGPV